MDGGDIFIGLAVIGFAALITIASNWKEWRGKEIARELEKQAYIELYEQTRRARALPPVQQRAPGEEPNSRAWTPACGNPVGYYGRMFFMQLFRRNTWKV